MNRSQALRHFMVGSGATSAPPAQGRAGSEARDPVPRMPVPQSPSLECAQPPDPKLSAKDCKPRFFDEHENETVIALSDLINPDTDFPGAKAAQVNRSIDLLLSASDAETQKAYLQALAWLDGHCLSLYSKPFTQLGRSEQKPVLTLLTHENDDRRIARGVALFRGVKRSIVDAYYRSEIG